MSSPTPPPLSDASPNTIEILWETHRKKVQAVVVLLCVCLAGFYGVQYYKQSQINAEWSHFAAVTGLDDGYTATPEASRLPLEVDLIESLEKTDLATLEAEIPKASPSQKPYLLWLIANRAVQLKNWERAESALAQLEADYPKHPLVVATSYPVQVRKPVKSDTEEEDVDQAKKPKKPELRPAKEGSMVSLLRDRIAAMKQYQEPPQFQKPEIPADAPKYRIKFSGTGLPGNGEVVIALMTKQAPEITKEFEKLVAEEFWKDIKVDEVQRPPAQSIFPGALSQFHFGFASTRSDNRTEWDTTKPSEHLVDETTGLSHFPGAVAARADADGKSQVDRIWITAKDAATQDGFRQVFAYVVEGMDVVKAICEDLPLASAQEDQAGRGKLEDNIKVESITKV